MEAIEEVYGFAPVSRAVLAGKINYLHAGSSLTLIGVTQADLRSRMNGELNCHLLLLNFNQNHSTSAMIDRVLDDLAGLVAMQWPDWPADANDKTFAPSRPRWRAATAAHLAAGGRLPRFKRLAREIEIGHLQSVLPRLVLVADIDSSRHERAAAAIAALEWCQRFVAVMFLLSETPLPSPPWQRILHRAILLGDDEPQPVNERIVRPVSSDALSGSRSERRLRQAIHADADLSGLFENEIVLQLEPPLGLKPRVDLLWRSGRVVVELDGLEHERDPNYGADRHRDYELMIAGYLVLRLTNIEIELDLDRALSKIRRVVHLRKTPS